MNFSRRSLLATALGFPAIVRGAEEATAPLDEAMLGLIRRYDIPGAALGIARGGKIAYAKGFGMADQERGTAVTADSRFRLASVSKPFTAAAVLRLCEQGKLSLDEAVLPKLALEPLSGSYGDSRWGKISVRHLLQHSGGWDRGVSGDAMFKSPEICKAAGIEGPADAKTTVRWMLGRKLDFNPGARYAYCNFGYCVLGRLIEAVTGQSYGEAVRKLVLNPCGASDMTLGHSLRASDGEVKYYQDGSAPSVFPDLPSRVAWPYGTFSMEANDANGGWLASVKDGLRFLTSLDEGSSRPLLQRETMQAIYTSTAQDSQNEDAYYGLGWLVRPKGQQGRPNLWHIGGLPGTKTIAVRLGDGFDWIALFNSRPGGDADGFDRFNAEVQKTVHQAARKVRGWA